MSFLLLFIPALILAVNMYVYKVDVIYVLYDEHIIESAQVFGILILGFIPISVSYIFGTLLTANGNLRELNMMAGITVVLNLILNFILIPQLKAYGAALASLTTQSISAAIQLYIAYRVFAFKPKIKIIISILAFTLWIILAAYVSNEYIINRPIALTVTLTIGILSAFAFKLIDIKTVYRILKYEKQNKD
jgi:O-antigen/teichoic acid export membrane protein